MCYHPVMSGGERVIGQTEEEVNTPFAENLKYLFEEAGVDLLTINLESGEVDIVPRSQHLDVFVPPSDPGLTMDQLSRMCSERGLNTTYIFFFDVFPHNPTKPTGFLYTDNQTRDLLAEIGTEQDYDLGVYRKMPDVLRIVVEEKLLQIIAEKEAALQSSLDTS